MNNTKKVSFITQSLASGGAERVTSLLANGLVNDYEVEVATFTSNDKDFYQLHETIIRTELELSSNSKGILSAILANFNRIRVIRRFLKSKQPDVVVAMMSVPTILTALAAIGLKVKIIGSERSYPPAMPLGYFWESLRKYSFRYLDLLVVLSEKSKEWALKNTQVKSVIIIPNPVVWPIKDNLPVKPVSNYFKPNSKFILAVGRLGLEKNHQILIDAFANGKFYKLGWKLAIAGEGPLKNELTSLINSRGLNEDVLLLGKVGNLGEWYTTASIFTLTSSFEGFPNTLIEAMSYGLGVISFDCDTGPRDIIDDHVNGLLIDCNERSLSSALNSLIENNKMRDDFGSEAIKVRETYAFEVILNNWKANL